MKRKELIKTFMMISNKKKDVLVYIEIFQRRQGLGIFPVCPWSVKSEPSPPLDTTIYHAYYQ